MNYSLRSLGKFCVLALVIAGGWGTLLSAETRFRMMSANISSGNRQTYDPGHGIRIFQGLKPDIVAIQEFNYGNNSEGDLRKMVDAAFGKDYHYYREPYGQIPNGVISRFPILDAGTWKDAVTPNRGFVWAKLQLPDGSEVWVISVHFSTRSTSNRSRQATEVARQIRANLPEGAYFVIAGDLNTKNRNESAVRILTELTSDQHVPVGCDGRPGTNASRKCPYDWVLPSRSLDAYHVPVQLALDPREVRKEGRNTFSEGLVFDSRNFVALEAVEPVRQSDSASSQMQHMAVVKDFEVPAPASENRRVSCPRLMAWDPPRILPASADLFLAPAGLSF